MWPLAAAGIFFVVFLGAASLVVLSNTTEWAVRQSLRRVEAESRALLPSLAPAAGHEDLSATLRTAGVLAATRYDANGAKVADLVPPARPELAPDRFPEAERGDVGRAREVARPEPPRVVVVQRDGDGFVRFAFDGRPLEEARRNRRVLGFVVPAAVLVLAALAIPFVRGLLRPIEELEETARGAESVVGSGAPLDTFARVIAELKARSAELEALQLREKARADALAITAETLVRSHPGGVLVTDAEGRLTAANPPARAALGLADDAVGTAYREAFAGSPEVRAALDAAAAGSPPLGAEVRVPDLASPEGSGLRPAERVLAATAARVMDADGRILGTLLFLEDRTRTKRLERELSRRRELASLGEMSAGIAHEFRNATATILGYVRLAGQPGDDEARRRHLEGIRREAEHVARVTGDFLFFARPERMREETVDIGSLVDEALEEERLTFPRVRFERAGAFGTARGDAALLRRALVNLLRNAGEAAGGEGGGGRVVVRGECEPGGVVRLAVEDDGPGVPPEHAAKVFVPFFSTKESGTGIGLALVAKIAALHGGSATVERSDSLGGARFALSLPPA